MDLLNKKGLIKISRRQIEIEPEELLIIFKDLLVLDVEYNPLAMEYKYKACSKYFDLVEEGEEIPYYIAINGENIKWYREPSYYKHK